MALGGSDNVSDRIFAALPYLLPLLDAVRVGEAFFQFAYQFPFLEPLVILLRFLALPAAILEGLLPLGLGSLVIFFALLMLVVRNPNISHFIRFNTLQAILLGFIISILGLLLSFVSDALPFGLLLETLSNVIFFGGIAAVAYSIFQSLSGRYAEIPTISEAVHMQVR